MATRSALTAALNDEDAPKADFALSGRRMPGSMREDVTTTLDLALGSSVDARSNFLRTSPRTSIGSFKGGVRYHARIRRRDPSRHPARAARSTPRADAARPGAGRCRSVAPARMPRLIAAFWRGCPCLTLTLRRAPVQSFDVGSLKASLAMVPPSPMFQTVAGVNPVLLRADSGEGQALRRKALRGAVVVIFTAGARDTAPACVECSRVAHAETRGRQSGCCSCLPGDTS